jgi:hypothetical protein
MIAHFGETYDALALSAWYSKFHLYYSMAYMGDRRLDTQAPAPLIPHAGEIQQFLLVGSMMSHREQ